MVALLFKDRERGKNRRLVLIATIPMVSRDSHIPEIVNSIMASG